MAAGNTYTPIATTNGTGASSITFSSITSAYTDLVLVIGGAVSSGVSCYIYVNGDTTGNYGYTYMQGTASSSSSGRGTTVTGWYYGPMHANGNIITANFPSYANTSYYKSVLIRQNSNWPTGTLSATAGTWRSSSAINSITVITGGVQTFPATTVFTLYGIVAA